jgi:hypothetical protein
MAERKIFAGARVKRLRSRLGLSQSQMAAAIGVSPSYLNLIERDQRPLTVQVLLKLSAAFEVAAGEFSAEDGTGIAEALKEVFSDPLLAGEVASPAELAELADVAPNAARGITRLHAAWREALERLSDLSHRMASGGTTAPDAAARLPFGRVSAYFEEAGPWFPALETAAEDFSQRLSPRDDPGTALKIHLREAFAIDVRILPDHVMPAEQARYDRHSQRLFLAERVPLAERPFLMARQAALMGFGELLDSLTAAAGMAEPEAARTCRVGFANRLAAALLAPVGRLGAAAQETGFDVLRLSQRFVLRPSRIMARLAALGASGNGFPSAFLVMLDASGGVLERIPGAGFPFPRFRPFCARLPLFDGLRSGDAVRAELVLPEGSAFAAVATVEEGTRTPGMPPPQRLSLLGWRRDQLGAFGDLWTALPIRGIGVTCRLCERLDCGHRMHPPITRPAGLHDHVVGPSDYELVG